MQIQVVAKPVVYYHYDHSSIFLYETDNMATLHFTY